MKAGAGAEELHLPKPSIRLGVIARLRQILNIWKAKQ